MGNLLLDSRGESDRTLKFHPQIQTNLKSTTEKNSSWAFVWMVTRYDFIHRLKVETTLYGIINSAIVACVPDTKKEGKLESASAISLPTVFPARVSRFLIAPHPPLSCSVPSFMFHSIRA